jgi:hypothetical protein
LILNLLSQEHTNELAARAAREGRDYHRAWVLRCFGPMLEPADTTAVDALVAATDLYVWKLLRLDLGRSAEETTAAILRMVRSIADKEAP